MLPWRMKEGESDLSISLSLPWLTVTAASPASLIRSSPFCHPSLGDGERKRGRRWTHYQRMRECDVEDDAGAAKLDTSPAVLSPSFIRRTFLPATSLEVPPVPPPSSSSPFLLVAILLFPGGAR